MWWLCASVLLGQKILSWKFISTVLNQIPKIPSIPFKDHYHQLGWGNLPISIANSKDYG